MARRYAPSKSNVKSLFTVQADFDKFLKEVDDLYIYEMQLAQTIAIMAVGDKAVFTRTLAVKAAQVVRATINNPNGKGTASVNWTPWSDEYKKSREEVYGKLGGIWNLTGSVLKNITVRKASSANGFIVGLDKRKRVPIIGWGGKRNTKVSLETYASAVEYGIGAVKYARPLFAPSVEKVLQEDYPKLVRIMQDSLKEATKKLVPKKRVSATASGSFGDSMSSYTTKASKVDEYSDAILNDMYSEVASSGGFQIASKYDKKLGMTSTGMKDWTKALEDKLTRYLDEIEDPDMRAEYIKFAKGNPSVFDKM